MKAPFCDGHHIVKVKPAIGLHPSKLGLTGECYDNDCLHVVSGGTGDEAGQLLSVAPVFCHGIRSTTA